MLPKFYEKLDKIIDKIKDQEIRIKKLDDLTNLMQEYKKELFVCVSNKGVSPTNNKAEQKLRHLVLKRKNSFGTKSDKGNQTLSINMR
ncbi:MAG: transposase [bacterium]